MKVAVLFALCLAVASAGNVKIGFPKDDIEISLGDNRVIRGQDAEKGSAPFIASLSASTSKYSHVCGGSIINTFWVATAAHCNTECATMMVFAGLHHRDMLENGQQRITNYCSVHEEYGNGVGPFDIALLRVSEPFTFNKFVQPVILPSQNEVFTGEVSLFGWGQKKAHLLGVSPKMLQYMNSTLMYYNECKPLLGNDAPLVDTNLCTSSMDNRRSACNGDSGGPLVKKNEDGSAVLVGIVSWGYIPCGATKAPSVYTAVSSYRDWIETTQSEYEKSKF